MDDDGVPPPVEAELAELRRRAYGPDADIASDPVAQARLSELEAARRRPVALAPARVESSVPAVSGAEVPRSTEIPTRATAVPAASEPLEPSAPARRGHRPRWHTGLVVTVAVLAVFLGAIASEQQLAEEVARAEAEASDIPAIFDDNATVRVLMYVPLDRPLAGGDSEPVVQPDFPVPDSLRWADPLGEFYGWDLWRARSSGGLPCILVADGDESRARCLPAFRFDAGELGVTVPYLRIGADERPEGMKATESIGFWWLPDGRLCIVMGRLANAGSSTAADTVVTPR